MAAFVDVASERYERIDILINCAGILTLGEATSLEPKDFDDSMAVMFRGPLAMTLGRASVHAGRRAME